jgi:hypothetical protein
MINPLNNPVYLKVMAFLKAMTPKATGNKNLELVADSANSIQLHLQDIGGEIVQSNDGLKGFLFTGYALQEFFEQMPALDSYFEVSDVNFSGSYRILAVKDLRANRFIVPMYKFDLLKIIK